MDSLKKKINDIKKDRKKLSAGALLVIITFLAAGFTIELQNHETSYNLQSQVELEHIEKNKLGNAIIRTESSLPVPIKEPELKACIYTGKNQTPTILPVETTEIPFSTSNLETLNLTVTVPENKLDQNYPQGEVNLTMNDRCPLRSQPKIVLTEK